VLGAAQNLSAAAEWVGVHLLCRGLHILNGARLRHYVLHRLLHRAARSRGNVLDLLLRLLRLRTSWSLLSTCLY